MPLWGLGDADGTESLPKYQKNRNTEDKNRPAINANNQTYLAPQGFIQRVQKTDAQGNVRYFKEILVATSKDYSNGAASYTGAGVSAANVTNVTFQDHYILNNGTLNVDVAFDHQVIAIAVDDNYILVGNDHSTDAIRARYTGTGNGTNVLTFANSSLNDGANPQTGDLALFSDSIGSIVGVTITKGDLSFANGQVLDTQNGPAADLTLRGLDAGNCAVSLPT